MRGWLQTPWKCFIAASLFLLLISIFSSLYPALAIVVWWSFFSFRRHPFSQGAHSSVAESKAAPWQSVRGYDKNPGTKEPLCNLMCPESGHSVHFNEPRSPFSKREAGGHGNSGSTSLKEKHSLALRLCGLYVGCCRDGDARDCVGWVWSTSKT